MTVIGWLNHESADAAQNALHGGRVFVEGFRLAAEVGFSDGRDVTVEYHTGDGHIERLSSLAADPGTPKASGAHSTYR